MRALLQIMLVPTLAACSYTNGLMKSEQAVPTLADLKPVSLLVSDADLPSVNLEALTEIYQQALAVSADPDTREQVLQRLADLQMLQGEAELALAETNRPLFNQAIASYQSLLRNNPGAAGNDRLLYHLSKAYDLNGDRDESLKTLKQLGREYPNSAHYVEAKFRLAEDYFSAGDYRAAELAYLQVTEQGDSTAYYRNALYMLGWSQFKQDSYHRATASFSLTLDLLMPADNDPESLPRGQREVVEDSFRVLAIIFSYQQGPDSIAAAYQELGYRPYHHLIYQRLGELYRGQKRYRDSAETYRAYTRDWPDSDHAHAFQISVIQTYEAGGFPDLIVLEKEYYVEAYGLVSDYWSNKAERVRETIEPTLKVFIEELATHYHALAQQTAGEADTQAQTELVAGYYRLAAEYYQLFINSFSGDARVPELAFLLAESRWEAGDVQAAIDAYEWVAYRFVGFEQAADAGYSAVTAYDLLLPDGTAEEIASTIQFRKIDSQLQFVTAFSDDARAPLVLKDAANTLLELREYQLAVIAAATLTHWQPRPAQEVLIPAWLIMAHSHFESGEFGDAEQAYLQALARMSESDDRRGQAVERVAASVYRQAEALVVAAVVTADHKAAADQFARVIDLAPGSSIRLQAQYDAAVNYMAAAEFSHANRLLIDFRQRYPAHPLTAGVAVKLAHNYEQLQQWEPAARELEQLQVAETDPERKRQLHYIVAEYYDQAGNYEQARLRYRSYAHAWKQPAAVRFEAMNRLAELYDQADVQDKRRFWLRKIISAHDLAQEQRSERSLYLAAAASSILAEDEFQSFQAIEIAYPMAKSLRRKKAAMQKALAAYQKSHDYGVGDFSTRASYKMGEVFRNISENLLNSERPGDIDALALEQYEILLEEQAYPFEEKAIAIHESNAHRSWDGVYDQWVQQSFATLAQLLPARYAKTETGVLYSQDIY